MNIINEMAMLRVNLHNEMQILIGIFERFKEYMTPTRYYERVLGKDKIKIVFKYPNTRFKFDLVFIIRYQFDILSNLSKISIDSPNHFNAKGLKDIALNDVFKILKRYIDGFREHEKEVNNGTSASGTV